MNNYIKYILENRVIVIVVIFFITINGFTYTVTEQSKKDKIEIALKEELDKLQLHYQILLQTQKMTSVAIYKSTINQERVIQIIAEANSASKEKRAVLRDELHKLLAEKYEIAKGKGVLQYHFTLPDNESFLRMHKPIKFGDDLSSARYDFNYTNRTQKPIRGFAQGRTAHGFRNVFPLFDKDGKHIGAMEVSFSSDSFQWYLNNISHIHTHFLVFKGIFQTKAWNRDDLILNYLPSAENSNYMITLIGEIHSVEVCIDDKVVMLKPVKEEIERKMLQGDMFSLYFDHHGHLDIVSFLPIQNVRGKLAAWLVSYTHSDYIQSIIKDTLIERIAVLISSLIFLYFIYKQMRSRELLMKSNNEITILKERLELVFLATHDGLWDRNLLDNSLYLSPRWKEIIGYSDEELPNTFQTWRDRIHPDDIEAALSDMQENIDGKTEYYEGVHRLKRKDGQWIWILNRGKTIYDTSGKAIRMLGTHTDISDEKTLQLKNSRQAQIIEQIRESVVSIDLDGIITSWNHGSEALFGYRADEAIGQYIGMIYLSEDQNIVKNNIKSLLKSGEDHYENRLVTKSNQILDVDLSLSVLRDEKSKLIGMIGYFQDITDKKIVQKNLVQQKEKLNYQAHHDPLTALPNRILFYDRLAQSIEKIKRNDKHMALFFIDLDYFKEINDSLGHAMGDEVLKMVTDRLSNLIRKEDTLARLGGDEFTIIVEDLANGEDASILAQKVLEVLVQPMKIKEHILYISSSIGISLYPDDGTTTEDLLKYADVAMYKAKAEGRNNFQFYSVEMTELAIDRVMMEANLREAIKREDFTVYYQPQIDARDDTLIGLEALVRWRHITLGLVLPDKFIQLAEETGLIVALDRIVMKKAMRQISKWYKEGLTPGLLALNLTERQLQQKDFISMLEETMEETKFKAEWLEFEISESQIMTNPEETIKILERINRMGIKLAVDDFGTGYSSLSYLKTLPIDKLKIDQSFVREIPDNEDSSAIIQAVIALSKSLRLSVIAEGVETKEQKDFLVENGCYEIQGYFYGKAIPPDKIEVILRRGLT